MAIRNRWPAVVAAMAVCLLAACAGPSGSPAQAASSALLPVSLSSPGTPEADEAVGLCVLRDHLDQVVGMTKVPHGSDVPRYAAVPSSQPEIQTTAPVWVVRYSGVVRVPIQGTGGATTQVDAQTPTCIVVGGVASWLLTGPATAADGSKLTPLPAPQSLLPLPTLAP